MKMVEPFSGFCFNASPRLWTYISARRLVAPMTLVGFTALSVETMINRLTPYLTAREATCMVPFTLLTTAVQGSSSMMGTCLYAAAWKIKSGLYSRMRRSIWRWWQMLVTAPAMGICG